MRVLVTGASGHIGSAVVPELLAAGDLDHARSLPPKTAASKPKPLRRPEVSGPPARGLVPGWPGWPGWSARPGREDERDDPLGEIRGDRQTVERVVPNDGWARLRDELDVGVGAQLAALDGAAEHRVHVPSLLADDGAIELGGQLGKADAFGGEGDEELAVRAEQASDHGVQDAREVGAHVAGVGQVVVDARADAHGIDDELGLVLVAAVDRGLADARSRGDAFDAEAGVAVLDELVERGVADRFVAGWIAPPPRARALGVLDGHQLAGTDWTAMRASLGSTSGAPRSGRARAGRKMNTPIAAVKVMQAATRPMRWIPLTKLLPAAFTI